MAQADQTIQNDTFPTVRADINNNLAALFTNSSGAAAPTVTVAYQDWIDTSGTDPIWKKRNAANNAWLTVGTIKTSAIELDAANVLPSQTGNSGKFLTTNGTAASWIVIPPGSIEYIITSSQSWVKPSVGTTAMIMLWGGGGGGASRATTGTAAGGGGGCCTIRVLPLSVLAASCSVTIAAGGAGAAAGTNTDGNVGGTSSFVVNASHTFSAFGGGPGDTDSGGGSGGAGGGSGSAGGKGSSEGLPEYGTAHGPLERGESGVTVGPATPAYWGGGGGSGVDGVGTVGTPGRSFYGGGGGAGANTGISSRTPGGASVVGGDGGRGNTSTPGQAGFAPGGGGGGGRGGGTGGRGECRIYVW